MEPVSEQDRKDFTKIFEELGDAIYSAVKHATNPTTGGLAAVRDQWRQVGNLIVDYVEEK